MVAEAGRPTEREPVCSNAEDRAWVQVNYLLDKSVESSKVFWNRNSVFLVIILGLGSVAIQLVTNTADTTKSVILLIMGITGFSVTAGWIVMSFASLHYAERYRSDAKNMAYEYEEIRRCFHNTLFPREPESTKFPVGEWKSQHRCHYYLGIQWTVDLRPLAILIPLLFLGCWAAVVAFAACQIWPWLATIWPTCVR